MNQSPSQKRRLLVDDSNNSPIGPYIKIKFKRKLVNQTFFSLRIKTHMEEYGQPINKQYKDFSDLQMTVNQITQK